MGQLTDGDHGHPLPAERALEVDDAKKVLAAFDRIDSGNQGRAEVLRMRVRVHAHARQWEFVVIVAGVLASKEPDQHFGAVHYSDALRHLGRFDEAVDLLLPIAHRLPDCAWPAYHLACALCRTGDDRASRHWLARAFEKSAIQSDLREIAQREPDLLPLWSKKRELVV